VHSDYLGSIRTLTDDNQNVTDTYTYDAFGQLLKHTGTDPQPYAFAGEPLDPNVGFQYHRARWMDPASGRFTGMDAVDGATSDPTSLHKYAYANSSPVNRTDPTGLFSAAESMSVAMVMSTLASFQELFGLAVMDRFLNGDMGADTGSFIGDAIENTTAAAGADPYVAAGMTAYYFSTIADIPPTRGPQVTLVDTNVLIDAAKGKASAIEVLNTPGTIATTEPCLEEFLARVPAAQAEERNALVLRVGLRVIPKDEMVRIFQQAPRDARQLYGVLRNRGKFAREESALAAIAKAVDAEVISEAKLERYNYNTFTDGSKYRNLRFRVSHTDANKVS
jgi:RHS repeat-associated protein